MSWNVISTASASADATIDFTSGIDATYALYAVRWWDVIPASDNKRIFLQLSTSSTFQASTYRYHSSMSDSASSAYAGDGGGGSSGMMVSMYVGNASGESTSGIFYISNPSGTAQNKNCWWEGSHIDADGDSAYTVGGGHWIGTTAIDGIRFKFGSGNITSGEFVLYGITTST